MPAFALALLVKALVPAGYMPMAIGKTLTVMMCDGQGGKATLTLPLSRDGSQHDHRSAADHPCVYSALGGQALEAADPVMLAEALLFAFVFALLAVPLPPLRRISNLRPPLRGPPAAA